ncbi:5'-methylthioadenosine/S-adenosylhomocysteine nucleosidase [Actinoplanes sp. NPDC048967]|uniref:5'-methylthioadenosine/S-adenosylhomocysteine nucleosidase n=1 Tax=Actinoplanes sp. NPDC048967 TaxID=3155269 RepID=UPI0033C2B24D
MSTDDGARIVVLTALSLEYAAVREHLGGLTRRSARSGTQYEVGPLGGARVAIAEVGAGNVDAALVAGEAIDLFRPEALFFVGVAGALSDKIALGSVVVATRVFAVHGAKEQDDQSYARPRSFDADHELLQRARVVAREFQQRPDAPEVHFAPIAAGEVVLNSRTTPLAQQLKHHYNDAVAIEMESAGTARAAHVGRVRMLTVRGISDQADGLKAAADAAGSQPRAARHAAAFAVEVITDFLSRPAEERPGSVQNVTANGGTAFGVMHGSMYVHSAEPPSSVEWRQVSRPPQVTWRSEFVNRPSSFERAALELHLVPATESSLIELRRLRELAPRLAGELPAMTQLVTGHDDRAAWAWTTDYRSGPAGRVVSRSGQRSAWEPLPGDSLGAVLDEEWIIACLRRMIASLTELDLPSPVRWALALGVEPTIMLSVGRADSLPRTSASMGRGRGPLQVPAEESVPASHLAALAGEVAAELAARLLAAHGRR